MTTFTLDTDNNITAHDATPAAQDNRTGVPGTGTAIFPNDRSCNEAESATDCLHHLHSSPDPPHHRHRHGVADGPVARPIGGGFATVRDQRPVVRKSLEPFALTRHQSPHRHAKAYETPARLRARSVGAHRAGGVVFADAGLPLLYAHRNLPTAVRVTAVMRHGPKGRSETTGVRAVILRREGCDQWRASACAILAGIESFSAERMRHERLALAVHPPAAALAVQSVSYERSGPVEVVTPATCSRAAAKSAGNFFPRLAARRRIPAHALALKKYRRGTSPVSKMSDNEDATATLGHSEELSVQHPPGATIPEVRQRREDGAKVPASVRGQNSGNVFPDNPTGPKAASKPAKFEGQVATRVIQAASSSSNRERHARGTHG